MVIIQSYHPIILANDTPHQEPSTAFLERWFIPPYEVLRIGYDFNKLLKNKVGTLQTLFPGFEPVYSKQILGLDPEISGAGINMV